MDKLIIYPKGTGIVEVYPSGAFSIEETTLRDVPTGVKYKIINVSELPSIPGIIGSLTLLQILTE